MISFYPLRVYQLQYWLLIFLNPLILDAFDIICSSMMATSDTVSPIPEVDLTVIVVGTCLSNRARFQIFVRFHKHFSRFPQKTSFQTPIAGFSIQSNHSETVLRALSTWEFGDQVVFLAGKGIWWFSRTFFDQSKCLFGKISFMKYQLQDGLGFKNVFSKVVKNL